MQGRIFTIDDICAFIEGLSDNQCRLFSLVLGALSALSFAPLYLFLFYIITLPLLLIIAMKSDDYKIAFSKGYLFGFGHFFAGLYWIGNSTAVEASVPDWAGYILVAVLSSYLAVFIAVVTGGIKYIYGNKPLKPYLLNIVVSFIVIWSIGEWVRGFLFTGFPWNLSGYILGFSDIMMQSTSIWGSYAQTIIVLMLSFVPFLMMDRNSRVYSAAFGVVTVLGLIAYGTFRIPVDFEFLDGAEYRVVQANIAQQDKWPYENWGKNLITHMDMSEQNEIKNPTFVIWPETAVIYSLSEEPTRRQLISKILDNKGGAVLTGFPRRQRDPDGTRLYNSFAAIDDQGQLQGIYDKNHLVPFGEYIPGFIRSISYAFGLDKIFTGGQDFAHGETSNVISINGMPPAGVLICYEVIFPGRVINGDNRPDWLLNITNDAWYGNSSGPRQHLLQTRIRAIEEGLPLIRSASTGISAVVDPYGRIIDRVELNKRGVITSKLPSKLQERTFYSIYKELVFACISIILIIVNIVLNRRISSQER
jgi:apolipoprotein N-acyltransferase